MKTTLSSAPLVVGIDWADSRHQICILDGSAIRNFAISASASAYQQLLEHLKEVAGDRQIEICLEKSRVRLIYQLLMDPEIVLYLVDPKQAARFRESFTSSGAKDDAGDAWYLARMLQERRDDLRVWKPNDALTRKIEQLCHLRRRLVDNRTQLIQQLQAQLKLYYPLALALSSSGLKSAMVRDLLRRWPDPRKLKKAHAETLRRFLARHRITNDKQVRALIALIRAESVALADAALIEPSAVFVKTLVEQMKVTDKGIAQLEQELESAMRKHADANLFSELPGAGAALAPRLLVAFGSDRSRYQSADQLACYSGIAPVTRKSGKSCWVHRRLACPQFLRQTFQEFAQHARTWCPWSKAFYQLQRDRGMAHNAAIRKLAYKWIRILFRVWKNKTPYDPERYLQCLGRDNHPLLKYLPANS